MNHKTRTVSDNDVLFPVLQENKKGLFFYLDTAKNKELL